LTETSRLRLSEAFARREVYKEYLALVSGLPPRNGQCTEPIGRHPTAKVKMAVLDISRGGKAAHTEWQRLWQSPEHNVSLLSVRIHTGRTHQIRVHMAHLGYPLLGDPLYAPPQVRDLAPRQMLHAWRLCFTHPLSGETLHFACPPPDDIPAAALAACRSMRRVVLTGNPACGKSSLAAALRDAGLPVLSADSVVDELYAPNGEAAQWIAHRWGRELLAADKSVDRQALMAAMQKNAAMRRELEEMVHALVRAAVERFWQRHQNAGAAIAVAEIPLYFECGWHTAFSPRPLIVGIHCPQAIRHERLMRNRGWDSDKIATLEAWQWSEERKEAACDILVDNSGSREALRSAAQRLLDDLTDLALQEEQQQAKELMAICSPKNQIRQDN
ncbi:MAG: dephospho-CoA kinase, partial [Desulfovibrionaceae bacterium]|nr:dephospho-CoA kinase [Desulfovibrionaceae bacterium]